MTCHAPLATRLPGCVSVWLQVVTDQVLLWEASTKRFEVCARACMHAGLHHQSMRPTATPPSRAGRQVSQISPTELHVQSTAFTSLALCRGGVDRLHACMCAVPQAVPCVLYFSFESAELWQRTRAHAAAHGWLLWEDTDPAKPRMAISDEGHNLLKVYVQAAKKELGL